MGDYKIGEVGAEGRFGLELSEMLQVDPFVLE